MFSSSERGKSLRPHLENGVHERDHGVEQGRVHGRKDGLFTRKQLLDTLALLHNQNTTENSNYNKGANVLVPMLIKGQSDQEKQESVGLTTWKGDTRKLGDGGWAVSIWCMG